MTMETAERNTSKQFSAKETVLRNVYKYSRIFFFFFSEWNECGGTESGSELKVFYGRNGPGLEGYWRWKSLSNSFACSSSVAGNHSESLSVSSYPSHITL